MAAPLLGLFGSVGLPELMIILVVGLLLFGTRLPKVARSLGQSVNEFKQGMKDPPQTYQPPKEAPERSDARK
jgi:sec-independent protein translocase protein TatA